MLSRPAYSLFMLLSLAVFLSARRLLPRSPALARLPWWDRTMLALAGFVGGVLGAKLPFVDVADGWGLLLRDGKTLTTGLVGAYLSVELAKFALGIRIKTGDSFALPLALALAVGRWGCFFQGCCFGQATTLPWGVDFGDGMRRHPTQAYECLFHLGMALVLWRIMRRGALANQRLKLYLIAYCVFRFATETIRTEPAMWLGLMFYQAVAVLFGLGLIGQWLWPWRPCQRLLSALKRSSDGSGRFLRGLTPPGSPSSP
jgi:phosphatidylglycerol:prolipoprotein diacylglycerol transferase